MIPMHYFLVLILMLLSMTGCTQRQPPSISLTTVSNNTAKGSPAASPAPSASPALQKIDRDPNPTIKPGVKTSEDPVVNMIAASDDPALAHVSISQLSVQNEGQWTLALVGEHAKWLYQLMEVAPHLAGQGDLAIWGKMGANYYCARFNVYICIFTMGMKDGKLIEVPEEHRGKKTAADLALAEEFRSSNLELDAFSNGKYGRLLLSGDDARRVYDGLDVAESVQEETATECDRTLKKGKHFSCERFVPAGTEAAQYRCRSYFNYDTGSFELIR